MQVQPQGSLPLSAISLSLTGDPLSSCSPKPSACPSIPPWWRSDNHGLLRSGENCACPWDLQGEQLDHPSLTPLSSRCSGSGFALSNQMNPEPHRVLVSSLATPGAGILRWETSCWWTELSSQLPTCLPPPILPATALPGLCLAASIARDEIQPCAEGAAWGLCAA